MRTSTSSPKHRRPTAARVQRSRATLASLTLTAGLLSGAVASAGSASASPTGAETATTSAAAAAPAQASTGGAATPDGSGGQLASGVTLHVGVSIYSPNHVYRLVVADYGDLLLLGPGGATAWHSGTYGEQDATLTLLADGDLVLRSRGGRVLFHTGTNGYGTSTLQVTDDGRLVLTSQRGVSWTSTGMAPRPHGGVSQGDSLGAAIAGWAAGESFSGRSHGCNPYSAYLGFGTQVGPGLRACPPGQARAGSWNYAFTAVALDRQGVAIPDPDWAEHWLGWNQQCTSNLVRGLAAHEAGGVRYTPRPGDVVLFQAPGADECDAAGGIVTEVNPQTQMVRLALGDADGAVLHQWMPFTGSAFEGRPVAAYGTPRTA